MNRYTASHWGICEVHESWFDPGDGIGKHGNPNVLTADRPASKLSQGCSAQTCPVSVERWHGALLDVTAFTLPEFVQA